MRATQLLKRLLDDAEGATAVEYGLIVSLIVIAIVGALQAFAGAAIAMWDDISATISAVM